MSGKTSNPEQVNDLSTVAMLSFVFLSQVRWSVDQNRYKSGHPISKKISLMKNTLPPFLHDATSLHV